MSAVARKIAASWLRRFAKYNPEFMQWVGQQRFRHPETGNRVLFQSLPDPEQTEIFERWKGLNQGEGAERRQEANRWLNGNEDPERYENIDFQIRLDDETAEEDKKRLADIFGTKDQKEIRNQILDLAGAGGIAAMVESVTVLTWEDDYEAKIRVSGRGKDGLNFERTLEYEETGDDEHPYMGHTIKNELFSVGSDAPAGMGTRMLASQVGVASNEGFSFIETEASGGPGQTMNGYYTWPRLGFNAELMDGNLEDLEDHDPEAAWQVRELAEADENRMWPDAPAEIFHVMAVPAARKWWEEEGHRLTAAFPLSEDFDGGKAYQLLRAYTEAKATAKGQTIPEYLSKIKMGAKKGKNMAPRLDKQDNEILDRVWEETRQRIQQKSKTKKQGTQVAELWLRRAVSPNYVEDVQRKMKDKDLSFNHLFGDKKRIVVPLPDLKNPLSPEVKGDLKAKLEELGELGEKDEIDWDSGLIVSENGRKKKLGKAVAKAQKSFAKKYPELWKAQKDRIRLNRLLEKKKTEYTNRIAWPLNETLDRMVEDEVYGMNDPLQRMFDAAQAVQGKNADSLDPVRRGVLSDMLSKKKGILRSTPDAMELGQQGLRRLLSFSDEDMKSLDKFIEEYQERSIAARTGAREAVQRLRANQYSNPDQKRRDQKAMRSANSEADKWAGQAMSLSEARNIYQEWPEEQRKTLQAAVDRTIPELALVSRKSEEALKKIKGLQKEMPSEDIQKGNRLKYLEEARQSYDRWKADTGANRSMVVSRAPVDVLRMSDHPTAPQAIESCHSEGGSYFQCARDEALGLGLVGYVVDNDDLKNLDPESAEIFADRDRDKPGIKPRARVRFRRYEHNEDDSELAIPELATYGTQYDNLLELATNWARKSQKEVFDKQPEMSEYTLTGGEYRDSADGELFNNFFDRDGDSGNTHHSRTRIKRHPSFLYPMDGGLLEVARWQPTPKTRHNDEGIDIQKAFFTSREGERRELSQEDIGDLIVHEWDEKFFRGLVKQSRAALRGKAIKYNQRGGILMDWGDSLDFDDLWPEETRTSPQQAPQSSQAPSEFWQWLEQSHPQVQNPNPEGRQRQITPKTLKDYAEGQGPQAQRAQQTVQQYYRQYEQQAQNARQASELAKFWLWTKIVKSSLGI